MSAAAAVIPLTTTFTPPSSCFVINAVETFSEYSASGGRYVSTASIYYTEGPTTSAPQCVPSGWSSSSFFSPGLCPSGYVIAFNSSVIINTITETRASCCPTELNADPSQTGALCQGYAVDQEGNVEGVLYAKAVSIRWQSTDFVLTPITTTSTTTPTAATTNTKSTSASLPEVPAKTHLGLTTGAKAGIGVGVTLGVILGLGAALGFFYFRRKRRDSPPRGSDKAENVTGADSTSKPKIMTEVSAAPDQQLAELPTPTYFITELPATDFSSQGQKPAELVGHVEH